MKLVCAMSLLAVVLELPSAVAQAADAAPGAAPAPFCAVEIGGRGVKGRLYLFGEPGAKNLPSLEPKYSKDVNTNLVSSKVANRFSADAIRDTAAAVAELLGEMKARQPDCKAFVVGSSSVNKGENKDELARAVAEKTELPSVDFVTPEQEARFAFIGSVPRKLWDSSAVVDIGSGNSVIAAKQGADIRTAEIPFGSASLANATSVSDAHFAEGVNAVLDAEKVRNAFRAAASRSPSLVNSKNTVLVGGTAWAMVTFQLPDEGRHRFVKITKNDLTAFRDALQNRTWTQKRPSRFAGGGVKQTFEEDSKAVLRTFTRDNLIAGLAVLQMFLDERATDGPIFFARSGNWIFGYVQEKFAQEIWGNDTIEDHLR